MKRQNLSAKKRCVVPELQRICEKTCKISLYGKREGGNGLIMKSYFLYLLYHCPQSEVSL